VEQEHGTKRSLSLHRLAIKGQGQRFFRGHTLMPVNPAPRVRGRRKTEKNSLHGWPVAQVPGHFPSGSAVAGKTARSAHELCRAPSICPRTPRV
jgi:hypothetical protein